MRYAEVREHVAAHFRDYLAKFRAGVDDAGPVDAGRYAALKATHSFGEDAPQEWAGLVHPDGPAGVLSDFCALRGIEAEQLTEESRGWMLDALWRGHVTYAGEALAYVDAMDRFDLSSPPSIAHGTAKETITTDSAVPDSYAKVLAAYFAELQRSGDLAPKTFSQKQEVLGIVGEILAEKPPAEWTKADAQHVKQVLLKYPKNRNKNQKTRGKPLSDVLDVSGIERISARTMNVYLSHIQTFMGWAASNGYAENNLFAGMQVRVNRSRQAQRDAFSADQLGTLFTNLTDNPFGLVTTDAQKWGALVGMFTGMRLNEIAQLETADIKQVEGIWCIDVTDVGDTARRLKTSASCRRVPLHDRLIAAGLLNFVEERRKAVHPRLFPDLAYCPKNGHGRAIGRWFNERLLPQLGMKTRQIVFHSLRHTMVTRLNQSDARETHVKAIVGHAQTGMTFSTYFKDGFLPHQLKATLDKFEF